ncbi:hypothetical protein SDC9_142098 [bioreactor metagenome]|uniref:Uncharacterized protein n=1 Tax=bioreactor metagenome TaxID=1076179 RepID=A0A645E0A2_9ZZZZ
MNACDPGIRVKQHRHQRRSHPEGKAPRREKIGGVPKPDLDHGEQKGRKKQ